MTDHPRFIPFKGKPDKAQLNYHGGVFVEWVLQQTDAVIAARHRSKALSGEDPSMAVPARDAKARAVVNVDLALATFGVAIVLPLLLA